MVQTRNDDFGLQPASEAPLFGSFLLDPKLALSWLDVLVYQPPPAISPDDYLVLLAWRRELLITGAATSSARGISPRGRHLLEAACREADARDPNWASNEETATHAPASSYAANVQPHTAQTPEKKLAWERMPGELWDALTAPTNIGGTALGLGLTADALIHSLPLKWHVTMQRGIWELYDENGTHRMRKYGKAAIGRARIPPRLVLRARGARIPWMWQAGARVGTNSTRFPVTGAKTVAEALRIVKADTMKLISKDGYDVLKLRGKLGGFGLGLALTVLPQAYVDARESDLFSHPDADHWRYFAVKEAKSQSANLAGFTAGMIAGAALASVGITAAPVVLVIGLAAGATIQAGFNAWGLSERIEEFSRSKLLGR